MVGIGLLLRCWNLPAQVLGDDELHLVRAILRGRVADALTTYRPADTSLPLTGLFRALFLAGAALSEMTFRLPALVAGAAALAVLPLAFARRLPAPTVVIFAGLVAVWPSLVLYSRIARSYMPMVLCAFLALAAFDSWWRTRRRRMAALYVGSAAMAVWLHPLALPAALAPLVCGALALLAGADKKAMRWRDLFGLGFATAISLATFLVPAWPSLATLLAVKRTRPNVPASTLWEVGLLVAGTHEPLVAALVWLAAGAGLVLLWRRQRGLAGLSVALAAAQCAGIALLAPKGANHPVALHRYLLPAVPAVLLWVATALGALWEGGADGRGPALLPRRVVAALLALAPLLTGPFADPGWWRSTFAHHNHYVQYSRRPITLASLPAIYQALPAGPILETPFHPQWELARSHYVYQRLHGRRVGVVTLFDYPHRPPLRFRNAVPALPAAILATDARALLVRLVPERGITDRDHPTAFLRRPLRRLHVGSARAFAAELTAAWGPPDWREDSILGWDLGRVRLRAARAVSQTR